MIKIQMIINEQMNNKTEKNIMYYPHTIINKMFTVKSESEKMWKCYSKNLLVNGKFPYYIRWKTVVDISDRGALALKDDFILVLFLNLASGYENMNDHFFLCRKALLAFLHKNQSNHVTWMSYSLLLETKKTSWKRTKRHFFSSAFREHDLRRSETRNPPVTQFFKINVYCIFHFHECHHDGVYCWWHCTPSIYRLALWKSCLWWALFVIKTTKRYA